MWIDDTDLTQLSQLLQVGPRELIEAIGGPWHTATLAEEDEVAHPGALFVGRAGPSVGILLGGGPLLVGPVAGVWTGSGRLHWRLRGDPLAIAIPGRGASDADVDDFLTSMGAAVEDTYARQQPALVTCRYCGRLVAPACAMDDRLCLECAAAIFGSGR